MPGAVPTIQASALRGFLGYVASRGTATDELIRSVGLDPALMADPDARVPGPAVLTLWEAATAATGDPDLGLHAAEHAVGPSGIFEYVLRSAATLGEAWRRGSEYFRLVDSGLQPQLARPAAGVAELSFVLPVPLPRGIPEHLLAAFVLRGRESTRRDWAPTQVFFAHPRPRDVRTHTRIFRSELSFSAGRYAIRIAAEMLELPLVTADPGLSTVLDRYAREQLDRLPRGGDFSGQVRAEVSRQVCLGDPGASATARRLHISARTLHRRLQAAGTTHHAIVEEVRRELARRHLETGELSGGEIAFALGYSEASAFHRAFRRWYGCSTGQFKKRSA